MIYFHTQRFKFTDFMVNELRFLKVKNMDKLWKSFFQILYITSQHNQFLYTGYFLHILHLNVIKSEINFKLKVKMNKILIYGSQV